MTMAKPGDRVRYCAHTTHGDTREIVLTAIVIRASEKQLLVRATNVDGSLLFRWISPRQLREAQHEQG